MIGQQKQAGFTAVELLITLFVAAAFLIAGYQLFNVVIKDGGQARAESTAGNVAYDYLRRYAPEATNPCTEGTILNDEEISIEGLSNARITVMISCPPGYEIPGLSKVEATITYNTPQQTAIYSTFTNGIVGNDPLDITNGLVGWWKLNGNTNDSIGLNDGTGTNITPATGQNGEPNNAYSFSGNNSTSVITFPASVTLDSTVFTFTAWVRPSVATTGTIIGSGADGGPQLRLLTGTFPNFLRQGQLDLGASSTAVALNTWSLVALSYSATGQFTYYVNGVPAAGGGTNLQTFTFTNYQLGRRAAITTSEVFNGSIDDVRVYNRVLSAAEIQTIYSGGAK